MTPFFASSDVTIYQADSRTAWRDLPESCADAIVTSPPYWGLRDYGVDGQIGLEDDPQAYIAELADLLTGYGERVMKPGGSLWLNLGDTYGGTRGHKEPAPQTLHRHAAADTPGHGKAGTPRKCLLMIPERVTLALIERGWILRNKVVWAKPNGMPSSVKDRLATKWEYVFHLVREPRYYYDLDAIRDEPRMTDADLVAARRAAERREGRNVYAEGHATGNTATSRSRPITQVMGSFAELKGGNPGDVWTIPTQPYPGAHFAVYPPELIRRPILATVPEQVCRACGKGRERVVEMGDLVASREGATNIKSAHDSGHIAKAAGVRDFTGGAHALPRRERKHVGWTDCGCDAGWQPGTVLDPFFGSGTTGVMARRLGRKTIGVELNPDYCRLAADRFREDVLPLGGIA